MTTTGWREGSSGGGGGGGNSGGGGCVSGLLMTNRHQEACWSIPWVFVELYVLLLRNYK